MRGAGFNFFVLSSMFAALLGLAGCGSDPGAEEHSGKARISAIDGPKSGTSVTAIHGSSEGEGSTVDSAAARSASTKTKDRNLTGPAVLVSGRITFWDGRPVTSASVSLASFSQVVDGKIKWDIAEEVAADSTGNYEVYGGDGSNIRVNITGDFPAVTAELEPMPVINRNRKVVRKIQKDIVIPEGHTVTGRVVDESNNPLAGVPVHIKARFADGIRSNSTDIRSADDLKTTTTATGEFTLEQVAAGLSSIGTVAPGYAPISEAIDIPTTGSVTLKLSARGGTIQGYVYNKNDSTPLADTSVSLYTLNTYRFQELEGQAKLSGADGAFRFDNVSSGTIRLFASKIIGIDTALSMAQPYVHEIQVQEGQTTDVVIFMYPGVSIAGLVYDKDTSEPVSGASIKVIGASNSKTVQSDSLGRYRINGIFTHIPSQIYISAESDKYVMESTDRGTGQELVEKVSISEDYPTPLVRDIPMVPVVTIRGKVVTRDEVPVSTAQLSYVTRDNFYRRENLKPTAVNADGTFELQVKPFTKGLVVSTAVGFAEAQSDAIDVLTEDIEDIKVIMDVGAVVQGVVLDPSGKPASEATVSNMIMYGFGSNSIGHSDDFAITEADGIFTLRDAPVQVQLSARKKDFAGSERLKIELKPGETRRGTQLQLRNGLTISGRVLWSDGTPAKEIYISASSDNQGYGHTESDTSGTFTFKNLPDGVYTIQTHASRNFKQVENIKTGTTDLEIIIEGSGAKSITLMGTVVEAGTGEPIKDFTFAKDPNLIKLPEPGKFQWKELLPGKNRAIEISSAGYETKMFFIDLTGKSGTVEQTFELGKQGAITGRIMEAGNGKVVPNVVVINYGDQQIYSIQQKPVSHTTTDAEGRFVLAPAPYGKNIVVIKSPPPNIALTKTATVKSEETTDLGVIELSVGGTITGRVVLGTGDVPAPDKEVRVSGYIENQAFDETVKTDADGKFKVTGVPPYNNFTVKCGAVTKTARITGNETVDVLLRLGGVTMSGLVTKGGQPARVSITGKGPEGQSMSTTSREDGYKFEGITPGHYDFQIGDLRESVTVPDQPEFKKDFDLPSGTLSVMVTDSTGEPVGGAEVAANLKDSPTGVERSWEIRSKKATSKADGTAELLDLMPGTYTVTAAKNDMGSAVNAGVTIGNGASQNVKLQLKGGGGTLVSVALKSADGSPHPNAWCYLYGPDGLFTHASTRDAAGVMTINNIPPGTYRTNVSYWSFSQGEQTVEIKAGETATIEDVLYGAGSIQWVLKKADGTAAAGANVTVTPLETNPVDHARTGVTDNYGNFEDRGMAQGTYEVTAQLGGKQPVTEVFEVRAGSHTAKDRVVPGW